MAWCWFKTFPTRRATTRRTRTTDSDAVYHTKPPRSFGGIHFYETYRVGLRCLLFAFFSCQVVLVSVTTAPPFLLCFVNNLSQHLALIPPRTCICPATSRRCLNLRSQDSTHMQRATRYCGGRRADAARKATSARDAIAQQTRLSTHYAHARFYATPRYWRCGRAKGQPPPGDTCTPLCAFRLRVGSGHLAAGFASPVGRVRPAQNTKLACTAGHAGIHPFGRGTLPDSTFL